MVLEKTGIDELWKLYAENRSIEVRNEIVLRYTGLVKSIVRRIASVSGSYADSEDLTSYGILGLIKAIEKFDLTKGVSFETFAMYRIRGEIIDYIRRNDWVPRGVRKRAMEFETASTELVNKLGRQPTEGELSQKLGILPGDLRQLYTDIEKFNLVSFEELIQETVIVDSSLADAKTPEGSLQESELLEVLAQTIEEMPERERLIITLYYYEELTLKEISRVLGISESRVSQLHSRAIEKMKKKLRFYING